MEIPTADQLTRTSCVPCEGGVPRLTPEKASAFLANVEGWRLTDDGLRLRREWTVKDFNAGIDFFLLVPGQNLQAIFRASPSQRSGRQPVRPTARHRHMHILSS